MEGSARVESIEALRDFRTSLVRFADDATSALGEAESEIQRTMAWLTGEAHSYWRGQAQRLQERVNEAKGKLRSKKMSKMVDGSEPSADEEEKELRIAKRQLAEAEQKLENVKRWRVMLEKEALLYKGQIQPFATIVETDIPKSLARLDRMIQALEAYMAEQAPVMECSSGSDESALPDELDYDSAAATMSRGDNKGVTSGPSDASRYAQLRAISPSQKTRDAIDLDANAGDLQFRIAAEQASQLNALRIVKDPPRPNDRVVVDTRVTGDTFFLGRIIVPAKGDSGWFIGAPDAATADASHLVATTIAALTKASPEMKPALDLPHGWLVLIEGGAITAAVNESNEIIRLAPGFTW